VIDLTGSGASDRTPFDVISHELRTPLTIILGWLQLAEQRQDPSLLPVDALVEQALRLRDVVEEVLLAMATDRDRIPPR
jgi:signal transduction histidine kinase